MVLTEREIRARLDAGEILKPGSWEPAQLRGAAYDVRLAGDLLLLPDGVAYRTKAPRTAAFMLQPGQAATVATVEKFCMPWNLAANIVPKFSTVRQGLLLLHGGLVDPGFGMHSEHEAKADERLYFLVVNVGAEAVRLQPGVDRLAALQFLPLAEAVEAKEITRAEEFRRRINDPADDASIGLEFFEGIRDVPARLDRIESRTQTVIVLGIYLLAFAMIAAIVTALAALATDDSVALSKASDALPRSWVGVAAALSIVCLLVSTIIAWSGALRDKPLDPLRLMKRKTQRRMRKDLAELRDDREDMETTIERLEARLVRSEELLAKLESAAGQAPL